MKQSTRYTPLRNFKALKKNLMKTQQRLILTQGDLRKLKRQFNEIRISMKRKLRK